MDTRLKSVTLLTFILLASLFASLLIPVSEARPLGITREVNGVFRTLKSSGPNPGVGHRLKKLQINLGGMKNSGPSPGIGHKLQNLEGHKLNKLQVLGVIKHSGPSPGQGHKYMITGNRS